MHQSCMLKMPSGRRWMRCVGVGVRVRVCMCMCAHTHTHTHTQTERERAREREREGEITIYMHIQEAESEWRFFSPEQYARYQDLRESRIKSLTNRKRRSREIALVSCEAEVSLDEYMGVMLDLGWAEPGEDLEIAQLGRSALSGSGRELGLDPRVEFFLKMLAYSTYALLIAWPVAPVMLAQVLRDVRVRARSCGCGCACAVRAVINRGEVRIVQMCSCMLVHTITYVTYATATHARTHSNAKSRTRTRRWWGQIK